MRLKCCSQTASLRPPAPQQVGRMEAGWGWPGPFLSQGWPRRGASSLLQLVGAPWPSSARAEQLLAGEGQT